MTTKINPWPHGDDVPVKRSDTQIGAELGTDTAILNLKTGLYFGLNEVGSRIWELLARPRTVREIVAVIARDYAVEEIRCAGDVRNLMAELERHGLIEVTHEAVDCQVQGA